MMVSVRLFIGMVISVTHLATATASSSSKPPVALPLRTAADAAPVIALINVGSAFADKSNRAARYEIDVTQVYRGTLDQACIDGPFGLKVGRAYLALISHGTGGECGSAHLMGGLAPYAFEINEYPGKKFVRLDNERLIPPRFQEIREIRQQLEQGEPIVIRSEVPMEVFVEYLVGEAKTASPPASAPPWDE